MNSHITYPDFFLVEVLSCISSQLEEWKNMDFFSLEFFHIFQVRKKYSYIAHPCCESVHCKFFHLFIDTSWTTTCFIISRKDLLHMIHVSISHFICSDFILPFIYWWCYWKGFSSNSLSPKWDFLCISQYQSVLTAFSHCLHR